MKYRDQNFRGNPILLGLLMGFLGLFFVSSVLAKDFNQLKNVEIRNPTDKKVQIVLEFSSAVVAPRSFSVENPASLVFDFLAVQNKLSKESSHRTLSDGLLRNLNVIDTANKTRLVLDLKKMVPFKTDIHGNIVIITVDVDQDSQNSCASKNANQKISYQIKSFDFHRGEHGEARIVFGVSTDRPSIDFKEEDGKIFAEFLGASIPGRLLKRYDVTDFGTPVQSIIINQNGSTVEVETDCTGDYDKIAYQLGNEFIIEVRSIGKDEKTAFKELSGKYTGTKLSLNFQDIEIRAVLQIIADFSKFNVITSDSVKGNITLRLQNVPWDQALDIILKSEGLDKRQFGNVMLVGPADELAAREKLELEGQKQVEDLGAMQSELIQINYAKAEDLASLLKDKTNSLMTSRGTVAVDNRTNTLLVQDIPSRLAEVRSLLKRLDIPVRQVEISTQIITADNTLASALGIRFGGGANAGFGHRRLGVGGSIDRARGIADYTNTSGQSGVPPSNTDLTQPPPLVNAVTGTALTQTGQPPNANITQKAYNTTGPTVNNTEGLFSDLGVAAVGGALPAKLGLALARLPNGTLLDLELQALEFELRTKTVARPRLVTMDQNKATVEQGVEIPYQEATSSGATSTAYKKAVLKLEVTPHITPDDKISLELSISNDSPSTLAGGAGVSINTNRLETKVLSDNGETIVLGGVMTVVDTKTFTKVPFFGDLPFIGGLFRSKTSTHSPKELIIFLTPRIINPLMYEAGNAPMNGKSPKGADCMEIPRCLEAEPKC